MSRAATPALPYDPASHPLLAASQALLARAGGSLHLRTAKDGEGVVAHGDPADHLWLVCHGWVKLSRQTPDGRETVVGLCTDGDIFGEAALFAHANYPYHAEALGEGTQLAALPASALREAAAADAGLSERITALLSDRMSQAQLKLEHMSTLSAAQRLGCFLLRLCHAQADGAKTLKIPVSKSVLAAYLGMKPETLSRSQQQLKSIGVEVAGQQVSVGNIAKLRSFVCDSCSASGDCDVEASAG